MAPKKGKFVKSSVEMDWPLEYEDALFEMLTEHWKSRILDWIYKVVLAEIMNKVTDVHFNEILIRKEIEALRERYRNFGFLLKHHRLFKWDSQTNKVDITNFTEWEAFRQVPILNCRQKNAYVKSFFILSTLVN